MAAQNEEMVGNVSALQIEIELMKSTLESLVGRIVRADVTAERQQNEITELKSYSINKTISTSQLDPFLVQQVRSIRLFW